MDDLPMRLNRLDQFRLDIDLYLALSDDPMLEVTGTDGRHWVVAALADELLSTLLRRIQVIGGCANVFIKSNDNTVQYIAVVDARSVAFADEADDMTGSEQPAVATTVGMFVAHLRNCKHGVKLPTSLTKPGLRPVARIPRDVEFAGANS